MVYLWLHNHIFNLASGTCRIGERKTKIYWNKHCLRIDTMENILILSEDGKTLLGVKNHNVREVIIPEGVEIIGNHAFRSCSMRSVHIPESVTTI